jgi:hypothetical protein
LHLLQRGKKIPPSKKIVALKLCKPEQAVEESELSRECEPIFHTLINICVENLILQKYFLSSSAQLLPAATHRILTKTKRGCYSDSSDE